MAAPFQLAGQSVGVQCSIGVSTSSEESGRVENLLTAADTAMFHAKAAGKANYVVFDESMRTRASRRINLEADLRAALQTGQSAPSISRSWTSQPGGSWHSRHSLNGSIRSAGQCR